MKEFVIFLFVLIVILRIWQRLLDRAQEEKVIEELKEAKDLGKNRAAGQYPQIRPDLCIGCGSCVAACPEDRVLALINGVAHVINGSRCVGHSLCEEACPVAAIKVGLGDLRLRPDVPILTEELETTVPGIYIVGELGGFSLIRHAINQGSHAIAVIAGKLKTGGPSAAPDVFDLLIVGAGPAGLSASFTALASKLRFATISADDIGGTVRKYPRGKLTLIQPVEIPFYGPLKGGEYSKEAIVEIWDQLIRDHPIPIKTGTTLTSLVRKDSFFEAQTTAGLVRSRTILLAMGRRGVPRKLGIPGENLEKVLYQLIETHLYTGRQILVVGGGDSAIEAATGLANQPGNTVTLCYRKEAFFRLKTRNEERIRKYADSGKVRVLFSASPTAIEEKSVSILAASPKGERRIALPNDYVFIFAGGDPPYPVLRQMGIRFGGEPQIATAESAQPI